VPRRYPETTCGGDPALDAGIDGVFDRKNIAEDGLGRLWRRHIDQIDGDAVGDIVG
jgi:hypothetical protein